MVSIIIRTKDEEEFIGQTLKAVCSQSFLADEIIIVDSGSQDRTLQIASRFKTEIVEIAPSRFTYGRALNTGFARARSEILVSLSADATPVNSDWLRNLISPFEDPSTAGVYGRQIPRSGTSLSEARDILACYGSGKAVTPRDHFFSNVNSAVRREVWEKVKFDETMPCAEDWDWAKRVQSMGYLVCYEPGAAVKHSHGYTFVQAYRRAEAIAYGAATLDTSLRMNLLNGLAEVIKETGRDMKFGVVNGAGFACVFRSLTYRFAGALGRYQGVRHSRTSHAVLTG